MRNGTKNVQNMDKYVGYLVDFWVLPKNLNSDLIQKTHSFLIAKKILVSKPCI